MNGFEHTRHIRDRSINCYHRQIYNYDPTVLGCNMLGEEPCLEQQRILRIQLFFKFRVVSNVVYKTKGPLEFR